MQSGSNVLPCMDSFSGSSLPLTFYAALPPVAGLEPLSLTVSSLTTLVSGSNAPDMLTSWAAVDSTLVQTYAIFGVDMNNMLSQLPPPSTLQPLVLAQAQSPTFRALGVAMMVAESQVTGFLALGAELLLSSIPGLPGGISTAIDLLSSELVAQAQRMPTPPPTSSLLTNALFVTSVITAAFKDAGSGGSTNQINMVSAVIASLAEPGEVFRMPAVQIMQGNAPPRGLDVLSAFMAMAQMPTVQADASAAVRQSVLIGSLLPLLPFLPAELPDRLELVWVDSSVAFGHCVGFCSVVVAAV